MEYFNQFLNQLQAAETERLDVSFQENCKALDQIHEREVALLEERHRERMDKLAENYNEQLAKIHSSYALGGPGMAAMDKPALENDNDIPYGVVEEPMLIDSPVAESSPAGLGIQPEHVGH